MKMNEDRCGGADLWRGRISIYSFLVSLFSIFNDFSVFGNRISISDSQSYYFTFRYYIFSFRLSLFLLLILDPQTYFLALIHRLLV